MSFPTSVGKHTVFPCASVCPSQIVSTLKLKNLLKYYDWTSDICKTPLGKVSCTSSITMACIFFNYFPFSFSSAVFVENLRYCYGLGVVVIVSAMQKLWHYIIVLLLMKIFNWNSEYVFTIERAFILSRETKIKMLFFFFFFFIIMPLFWHRKLTFSNICYYWRYLLWTRSMCSPSKEQSILSRKTIQNAFFFFFRIKPLFWLKFVILY